MRNPEAMDAFVRFRTSRNDSDFEIFYNEASDFLNRYAVKKFSRMLDPEAIHDCISKILCEILYFHPEKLPVDNPKKWLASALWKTALRENRRNQDRLSQEIPYGLSSTLERGHTAPSTVDEVITEESNMAIASAMTAIPSHYRDVIKSFVGNNFSQSKAERALGVSRRTFETRLRDARHAFKENLPNLENFTKLPN